jgi:CelD/BcsL family acetyltransferase involved in cellulose biosynthesis
MLLISHAFWIGSLYRDSLFLHFTGYDPAFGKYEPGKILLVHMIKELSSSYPHVRSIDYGFGYALYKQRFSNQRWYECSLRIAAPKHHPAEHQSL